MNRCGRWYVPFPLFFNTIYLDFFEKDENHSKNWTKSEYLHWKIHSLPACQSYSRFVFFFRIAFFCGSVSLFDILTFHPFCTFLQIFRLIFQMRYISCISFVLCLYINYFFHIEQWTLPHFFDFILAKSFFACFALRCGYHWLHRSHNLSYKNKKKKIETNLSLDGDWF